MDRTRLLGFMVSRLSQGHAKGKRNIKKISHEDTARRDFIRYRQGKDEQISQQQPLRPVDAILRGKEMEGNSDFQGLPHLMDSNFLSHRP